MQNSIRNATSGQLRLLHVLAELRPSGAEVMLCAAADAFARAGIHAEILATGPRGPGPFADRLVDAGYPVHHIPFRRSPRFFWRVRELLQGGRYDVVHLHTEGANFWFGLTALSARPRCVVRTIHNAFGFDGWLRFKRGLQRRLLARLGITHVAISRSVADTEAHRFGLATVRVDNWFDSRRFRPPTSAERAQARAALGVAAGQFVVVTVGNCSPVKNHRALIEAMALLPLDRRPLYLHVGIEEQHAPERRLAHALGVADRIGFLGPRHDVERIYWAADAFAMPSRYEGFGVAAIEALATGLPAILADCPGLRDFAPHFPGLDLIEPEPRALAKALGRLMRLPRSARAEMTSDYPRIAKASFGVAQGVDGYVRLYRGEYA